jgi:LPXTG-motif cell wall-anchored protein
VEYVMIGELHTKNGNKDGGVVTNDGKPVRVEVPFVPKNESGTVEVPFKAKVGSFNPYPAVAFEELRLNIDNKKGDVVLAEHKDITDADQTVKVSRSATDIVKTVGRTVSTPVKRVMKQLVLPQTGGDSAPIIGAIAIAATGVLGFVVYRRRQGA